MRVSEIYVSSQGEGPKVGELTTFVRFGGCNLRCPGWPCDTQHAIDPQYRHEWAKKTWQEVAEDTIKVAELAGTKNVTLTGGEPFLQKHEDLHHYAAYLLTRGYKLDCFSNGTILYPDWAPHHIQFIMDWKLPGSGEDHNNPVRLKNLEKLDSGMQKPSVKFVIKDWDDMYCAVALYDTFLANTSVDVYYGKVWHGELSDAALVGFVIENQLPWKLNVQLHNYIWPANERGR